MNRLILIVLLALAVTEPVSSFYKRKKKAVPQVLLPRESSDIPDRASTYETDSGVFSSGEPAAPTSPEVFQPAGPEPVNQCEEHNFIMRTGPENAIRDVETYCNAFGINRFKLSSWFGHRPAIKDKFGLCDTLISPYFVSLVAEKSHIVNFVKACKEINLIPYILRGRTSGYIDNCGSFLLEVVELCWSVEFAANDLLPHLQARGYFSMANQRPNTFKLHRKYYESYSVLNNFHAEDCLYLFTDPTHDTAFAAFQAYDEIVSKASNFSGCHCDEVYLFYQLIDSKLKQLNNQPPAQNAQNTPPADPKEKKASFFHRYRNKAQAQAPAPPPDPEKPPPGSNAADKEVIAKLEEFISAICADQNNVRKPWTRHHIEFIIQSEVTDLEIIKQFLQLGNPLISVNWPDPFTRWSFEDTIHAVISSKGGDPKRVSLHKILFLVSALNNGFTPKHYFKYKNLFKGSYRTVRCQMKVMNLIIDTGYRDRKMVRNQMQDKMNYRQHKSSERLWYQYQVEFREVVGYVLKMAENTGYATCSDFYNELIQLFELFYALRDGFGAFWFSNLLKLSVAKGYGLRSFEYCIKLSFLLEGQIFMHERTRGVISRRAAKKRWENVDANVVNPPTWTNFFDAAKNSGLCRQVYKDVYSKKYENKPEGLGVLNLMNSNIKYNLI